MDVRQLIGLLGVLIAAMTSEFNDQVTSIALRDVQGGLAISHDVDRLRCGPSTKPQVTH